MIKYYLQLLILTVFAGIAYAFLGPHLPVRFYFDAYIGLLILFVLVTVIFQIGLQRSFKKGSNNFIRYYMGATGVKLFFFLTMIMIYAFINKANAVAFALCFFFFYIFYTVFEVAVAYKQFGNLKVNKTSDSPAVSDEEK